MADDRNRKVDVMVLLQLRKEGAQIMQFVDAEIHAFPAGASVAAQVDNDTSPALLRQEESPREHG